MIYYQSLLINVLLLSTINSFSQIYYVDAGRPDNFGAGTSWATAKKDLQVAINIAPSTSQIWVKKGIYKPTLDPTGDPNPANSRNKIFYIKDGLKIYGGFNGTETAINQRNIAANTTTLSGDIGISGDATDNSYHVVLASANSVSGVGVTVDGFTITGGNANTINTIYVNLNLIENSDGGGIYAVYGTNIFANNTISGNSSSFFGGGICTKSGSISITNNIISGNNGGIGGGIYSNSNQQFANKITNNIIFDNTASQGGGIYTGGYGNFTLNNNVVVKNLATSGGGIYTDLSNNTIFNNTIANNKGQFVGGLLTYRSNNNLTNNIFWGNMVGTSATITKADYDNQNNSVNTFTNNILQLPSATYTGSTSLGTASGNIFAQDPLFINPSNFAGDDGKLLTADDGLQIKKGSPCLSSGETGVNVPIYDILGVTRSTTAPTIGAYEEGVNSKIFLNTSIAASGDGYTWATAKKTIQEAFQIIHADTIWIATGTYTPTATLNMRNGLVIIGGFAGTETLLSQRNFTANPSIISGGNVRQVFNNSSLDNTAVLDGCIISNGNSTTDGAGMFNSNASPTIRNCVFKDNVCNSTVNAGGGAIYNSYSDPNITNCVFANNTVNNGLYGGGMQNDNSNPTISNCIFTGNQALGFGGGGGVGGGMFNYFSNPVINNSVFTGNLAADYEGGGMYNWDSSPVIKNTIIYGNSATANPNIANQNSTPAITYSNIEGGFTGTGNINSDPLFINASLPAGPDGIWMTPDDGLALQPCSPAINTGNATSPALLTDILGTARISNYEMGAYEYLSNISKLAPVPGSQFATSSASQSSTSITFYNICDNYLITRVLGNGANPIEGNTTTKVWLETTQPTNFVKRHYEITPANNAATATGRITLYFTQPEFDEYNAINAQKLPTNPSDATGKANLRIEKYPGTSSDGTGLPNTYTGTPFTIDPDDNNIVWNAAANRWEVNFDVVGFSGLFVNAASAPLPVNLTSFSGKATENGNLLHWKTANEKNFSHFEIERSPLASGGGKATGKFEKIGSQVSNESGNYEFLDNSSPFGGGGGYYRLKMVDLDGKFSFSKIIAIDNKLEKAIIGQVYPNPSTSSANFQINAIENETWTISVVDITGKILQTFTKNLSKGSQIVTLENLQQGLNYIKVESGNVLEFRKVIKN